MGWYEHHYALRINETLQSKVGDKYGVLCNEEFEVFEGDPCYDCMDIVITFQKVPSSDWDNCVGGEFLRFDPFDNKEKMVETVEKAILDYFEKHPEDREYSKQFIKKQE